MITEQRPFAVSHLKTKTLTGFLKYFSVTATEGAYLAFQDSYYISYYNFIEHLGSHVTVYDGVSLKEGMATNVEHFKNGKWISHFDATLHELYKGHYDNAKIRATVKWKDGTVEDKRSVSSLMVKYDHPNGLHILKDTHHLKILNPQDKSIIWQGEIKLKRYPPYTQHINNCWIRTIQMDVDNEEWSRYFFDEYPAELDIQYDPLKELVEDLIRALYLPRNAKSIQKIMEIVKETDTPANQRIKLCNAFQEEDIKKGQARYDLSRIILAAYQKKINE